MSSLVVAALVARRARRRARAAAGPPGAVAARREGGGRLRRLARRRRRVRRPRRRSRARPRPRPPVPLRQRDQGDVHGRLPAAVERALARPRRTRPRAAGADDPALGQRHGDDDPQPARQRGGRAAGAPRRDDALRGRPRVGLLADHAARPDEVLPHHRRARAGPPPGLRDAAAAHDRLLPALGHGPGDPRGLAAVLQGRLGLGQRRRRPSGRAAAARRQPHLDRGDDRRQPEPHVRQRHARGRRAAARARPRAAGRWGPRAPPAATSPSATASVFAMSIVAGDPEARPAPGRPRRPAIVAVDDEPAVLAAVARDLRRGFGDRYRIVRATSGAEALDLLRPAARPRRAGRAAGRRPAHARPVRAPSTWSRRARSCRTPSACC